ncbi:hypothetical protein GCM10029992_27290 [Glycomyces albus]
MLPGSDQARDAVLADQFGIRVGRSGVADGQDPGVVVGAGQRAGLVERVDRDRPAPDADVAVGVHQAGQGVAARGDRLGAGDLGRGQSVAVDVEVADGVVGQPDHSKMERRARSASGSG